jgi:hypothetical protein
MPRGGEQRVGKPLPPIGLQQGTRQPKRFEPEQELPRLAQAAGPEQIFRRRVGAVVDEDRIAHPEISRVPETPGGDLDNPRPQREVEIGPRGDHPAEEGLPDRMRLLPIETLKRHSDYERVVPLQRHDVPPMGVQQAGGIERDELPD